MCECEKDPGLEVVMMLWWIRSMLMGCLLLEENGYLTLPPSLRPIEQALLIIQGILLSAVCVTVRKPTSSVKRSRKYLNSLIIRLSA